MDQLHATQQDAAYLRVSPRTVRRLGLPRVRFARRAPSQPCSIEVAGGQFRRRLNVPKEARLGRLAPTPFELKPRDQLRPSNGSPAYRVFPGAS